MKLTLVKSSQIHGIAHDPATNVLHIQFKNKSGVGSTYTYPNVTAEKYAEFLGAESKGKYFSAHIKNAKDDKGNPKHPHTKV